MASRFQSAATGAWLTSIALAAPLVAAAAPPGDPTPGTLQAPAAPAPAPAAGITPAPSPTPGAANVPPMTLHEAIAYAQNNNPRIAGAAAQVRQARAVITQRRAVRGPQTGVNNYFYLQGPVVHSPGGGNDAVPRFRYNVGVYLDQVIFDWGQRAARQRVAERDTAAAGFRLGETQNDVALVVSTAFFNLLRAQELLSVAQERRTSAAEQLRVARARFESDVAPRFDVLRSEAELASADLDVTTAQNQVLLAESTFNNALGRDVKTPVRLQYTQTGEVPDVPFEIARDAAIRNRPQLAALRETIEGSKQEVRARKAENKPQITGQLAYDRPNPGGFASTEYHYSAGLVMTFPFFDSGLTRGRVREAEATTDVDRAQLEQSRQQVELDVRQAQLDIADARQRAVTAQKELQSAREALRVAEVRYRAGLGTNVEVTDAQLAVAQAGQNVANAQFDYETALARLQNSTGTPVETLVRGGVGAPGTPLTPNTPGGTGTPGTPNGGAPRTPAAPGSAAPGGSGAPGGTAPGGAGASSSQKAPAAPAQSPR